MMSRSFMRVGVLLSAVVLLGCGSSGSSGDRSAAMRAAPDPTRTSDAGRVSGRAAGRHARECLRGTGLRLVGGSRSPDDTDAPDFELVVGDQALIGFYDDAQRAARYEPDIRASVEPLGGSVDRHGPTTVAWLKQPSGELRSRVHDCIRG
jgi:hypothetical protein